LEPNIYNTMDELLFSVESWFIILLILFAVYFVSIVTKTPLKEGFVNDTNDDRVKPEDIYDDFYAGIYDSLVYNQNRHQMELDTAIDVIYNLPKKQGPLRIMQVGSGSGSLLKALSKKLYEENIPVKMVGADISDAMIRLAKESPQAPDIDFIKADITQDSELFKPNLYNAVFCLYFTFYYLTPQQQADFFMNIYKCLIYKGKFILHIVNKHKFDTMLPSANPISVLSPQKYSKDRITQSKVSFMDGLSYVGTFIMNGDDDENKPSLFKETFKSGSSRRTQSHQLYFTTEKTVLQMASRAGLMFSNKIDMISCGYQHQYLLIFEKQ
jgi:ubiquinone/menaquinone biosynthesis C-methylase UbiE